MLVEVELMAPKVGRQWRLLGSLTERHGIGLHRPQPIGSARSRAALVNVVVPRAQTAEEAEQTVAIMLETVRRWDAAVTATIVPARHRTQRTANAHRPRSGVGNEQR